MGEGSTMNHPKTSINKKKKKIPMQIRYFKTKKIYIIKTEELS